MTGNRREPTDTRRRSSEFVRRAESQGESRMAVPHASLKRRAVGLMKRPLRTDLFRPAVQPYDIEEVFVPRTYNFVEGDGPAGESAPPPKAKPRSSRREPAERIEPEISLAAAEEDGVDLAEDDLDLPPNQPAEAGEDLELPDLEEYDGSELFDEADPDQTAEPAIPASERTELPSALTNRRNYYENSDEARRGGLLGGIIPGGGRPAPKTKARPRRR